MKRLLSILSLLPVFAFLAPTALAANFYVDPMTGTSGANWTPPLWTQHSGQGTYGSDGVKGASDTFLDVGSADQIIKFDYNIHADDTTIAYACRANSTYANEVAPEFDTGGVTHIDEGINGSYSRIGDETSYNNSTGTHHVEIDCIGNSIVEKYDGSTLYSLTDSNSSPSTGVRLYISSGSNTISNLQVCDSNGCETAAPKVEVSPATASASVGTPFTVNVTANGDGKVFNAAQATVAVSSNLSITGISYPTTNSCNFNYTKRPTTSDPSFAGAIFGTGALRCTAYSLTLTPTSTGTGTVTLTNAAMKAYTDSSDLGAGVQNGSFTLGTGPTATPTPGVPQLTVTSPLLTYLSSYTLAGGKDTTISHVFVNGSESGVSFPTGTTWQEPESLSYGDNNFTIYGSDGSNQTATQVIDVNRHHLGDINGDGVVDLTDASLFAVDYGKTSGLTYILSDMNNDGAADLTDLSILAKLEQ